MKSWHGSAYGKPAWLYTVEFHDAAGNPWPISAEYG